MSSLLDNGQSPTLTSTPTVADGDSQTSRFEFLLLRNCLHLQRDLVLCSLHRLTPQALRFLRVEYQTEFFFVLILGMFTIALSSFPGLPILLRRQHKAELRSYRLFDLSSRVGR